MGCFRRSGGFSVLLFSTTSGVFLKRASVAIINPGSARLTAIGPPGITSLSYGELQNRPEYGGLRGIVAIAEMRDFIILLVHLIVTVIRLAGLAGLRSVVAKSALLRHQLLILNRGRKRAPNLRATDRIAAGLFTLFMCPVRILRSAIVLKPSTLLHLHT